MNISDFQMNYYPEISFSCYTNCIRLILNFYGVKNADLYINTIPSLNAKVNGDIFIEADEPGFVLLENIVLHKYNEDIDGFYVLEEMKKHLTDETPLIASVDLFYLPYQKYYKKNHSLHSVIVSNIFDNESSVEIIDWHDPWFYKGRVDIKTFLCANSSKNPWDGGVSSGRPVNNMWTIVNKDGWNRSPYDLFKMTVEKTLTLYYERNSETTTVNYGHNGLYSIREKLNAGVTKEELRYIHNRLYFLYLRWRLFTLYLRLANKYIGMSEIEALRIKVIDYVNKWTVFLMNILKTVYSKNSTPECTNIIMSLTTLLEIEQDIYTKLIDIKNRM